MNNYDQSLTLVDETNYIENREGDRLLERLRREVANEQHHEEVSPYTSHKDKAFYYRLIFLSVGVLFLFFSKYIIDHPLGWHALNWLGLSAPLKFIACGFSSALAAAALFIACKITPEREAAHFLVGTAKTRLKRLYRAPGNHDMLTVHLRYEEALTHMKNHYSDAEALFSKIARTKGADNAMRERLYNLVLRELSVRLEDLVFQFKCDFS